MKSEEMQAEERYSQGRGIAELWAGFFLPIVAWALHLNVSYLLVRIACDRESKLILYLFTLVFAALLGAGVWLSWRSYERTGRKWPADAEEGVLNRSRFLAVSGLLLAGLFGLLIFNQLIPILVLSPCQ